MVIILCVCAHLLWEGKDSEWEPLCEVSIISFIKDFLKIVFKL